MNLLVKESVDTHCLFLPFLLSPSVSNAPFLQKPRVQASSLPPPPSSIFLSVCLSSRTHPPGRALFAQSTNVELFKHPLPLLSSSQSGSKVKSVIICLYHTISVQANSTKHHNYHCFVRLYSAPILVVGTFSKISDGILSLFCVVFFSCFRRWCNNLCSFIMFCSNRVLAD